MKKLLFILPLALMVNSCIFFKMDNYEGPNATISGRIIDSKTKENVPTECKYGNMFGGMYRGAPTVGYFSVYEKDRSEVYDIPLEGTGVQYWHIKYDGSYTNTQVFSGNYRIAALSDNFYPVTKDDVRINAGENVLDWEVTPYCRIINPKVELQGGKFVATFAVEYGDASKANTIYDARFLCYPDCYVGMYCNYCGQDPGAISKNIVADGVTINTLTIDPTNPLNYSAFMYPNKGKERFFRIAVCAIGVDANGRPTHNGSHFYNYSPTVKLVY